MTDLEQKQVIANKRFQKLMKIIHFANSAIFVVSAAYIFVYAILRTDKSWWFIVSISGYSTLTILLLLGLYLFAIYRGLAINQKAKTEHPVTTNLTYLLFYNISPLYGIFWVLVSGRTGYNIPDYILRMSISVVGITFLAWIIIDPIAGLLEMLPPSSRAHRRKRILEVEKDKKKLYEENNKFLREINLEEQRNKMHWQYVMRSDAQELFTLISKGQIDDKTIEMRVVEIGIKAFRTGGTECMKYLHSMVEQISKQKSHMTSNLDYISIWWDGIGNWRSNWLEL